MNKPMPDQTGSSRKKNPFQVTFEPMGRSEKANGEKTLFEMVAAQNITLRSDCGGMGSCGQCRVSVHPAGNLTPVTDLETAVLKPDQIRSGMRLACQTRPTGAVTVSIDESGQDSTDAVGKTDVEGTFQCDPMVRRMGVQKMSAARSGNASGKDMVESIARRVKNQNGTTLSAFQPGALQMLGSLSEHNRDLTLVMHREKGITAVWDGLKNRSLGVALDIGTTTLAAYLCDLNAGRILASRASANPQRRFGEDVISRITYSSETASGLTHLQQTVVNEINRLIALCIKETGAEMSNVDDITVVGNTTMEQVLSGIHPRGLGHSPYLPVSCAARDLRASDIGLDVGPETPVYVFPVISGFVGGDTLGAILSERPHETAEISLIVDIGTNGEVVLGNRDGLWATSCATGPALEGAHIAWGMRASAGAIHRVSIDPKTYQVDCQVLDDGRPVKPKGICGSGIIDAVAEMLRAGIVRPSGRIQEGLPGVKTDETGIARQFVLVSKQDSAVDDDIVISLADIRQIQLAKSALFAGIKLLMQRAKIDRFHRLILTGAFGARFNWKNAVSIGMLPESALASNVTVVGNAAGRGAVTALLDGNARKTVEALSKEVNVLELAEDPGFVSEFTSATQFPSPLENRG